MSGSREWDATTYDRVSGPQVEWARGVIERLGLAGDEVVLDAGCGSGRVTAMLLADLAADGSVIATDGSEAMVDAARERLAGTNTSFIHSDLLDLDLHEEVDAVFSNAVFHWIGDHERLFSVLHRALRPGGRFEAQCGGAGNVARFYAAAAEVSELDPFREHVAGHDPTNFAGPEETEERLTAAGFEDVRCWLLDWPVRPPEPREFVRTVCLGSHADRLPEDLREPFLEAVVERLGPEPELDYVRLNISAKKAERAES